MPKPRDYPVDAVFAGVDWISATLPRGVLDDQVWLSDAMHVLNDLQKQGYVIEARKLLGFDGYAIEGCFVGSNDKSLYASFSGEKANTAYTYLDHPKVHISRLDLQVTIKLSEMDNNEGKRCYNAARNHNQSLPTFRQRKVDLWLGSGGADTVYIGSPSSEVRGRIYNKEKQSGLDAYQRSWRYEAVYKNEHSTRMFNSIVTKGDQTTRFIISQVVAFFRERGVTIRGLGNYEGRLLEPIRMKPTDAERKLRWVKTQVVPTIRKLAELGYAEELMEIIAEAISAQRNEAK